MYTFTLIRLPCFDAYNVPFFVVIIRTLLCPLGAFAMWLWIPQLHHLHTLEDDNNTSSSRSRSRSRSNVGSLMKISAQAPTTHLSIEIWLIPGCGPAAAAVAAAGLEGKRCKWK
jgi:hypothetical protein